MTATSTTTSTTRPGVGYGRHPLRALAHAEYLQFRRNKTLLFMGTVFPIGLPLLLFFIGGGDGPRTALGVANTLEMFALTAMLMVQYYSVLSMVTTRRSEGVLKRLRTGEASDLQILAAPAVPGAALTLLGTVIVAGALFAAGGPLPVNPLLLLIALIGGLVIFTLLALATSAVTKNAEAAQITSIPVMVLSMVGLAGIRPILPDQLARIADWTPFAAVADLIRLGEAGLAPGAPTDAAALDFAATFAETGRPLATLVIWTVISVALVHQLFRWDDRG
ncbi:ABC-2 type transporter OS=Tsukamurella paurometabola (strain ATCC 8368 / DSM / CCUG 35730 /CIP 100753 / JCM 10117 / KCTC 9821 / NBRC 16120 / NCIMB 702349/ NCTC 13040) OX=521096 GN=Tpau_3532 PE=4 SV=1 [Tsukamurella paurometabola]|uniref:ABC-2 type transporter n=1 Tax=Tsukamurella paurometabola (strain ATCC 8368 / DSM 20162 / CCUG 35730 / CIP 100753 / JCM 10117 / KCTC 9821 / NBRC 16120 / NCIMB 702349 / NCTC 13040) TaxID=521096 RepID=D5UX92_TSUPD|nr:ABC transporter permease [Tsukamurella paurometabola]ADG80111.1 ABC-2 type transporter [Tsukamurella paurometabola DSM 20162]SUP38460.1 ABC-2 family transporter protein [Tsukamurella paurometabola]